MDEIVARGRALLDLGRARDAEQHFRDALSREPGAPVLHQCLARALLSQERYAEARDSARASTALDPQDPQSLYILSAAHAGLEQWDDGLSVVGQALRIAPEADVLHRQSAALLAGRGRRAEAVAAAERARDLDPEDALNWAMAAYTYALTGRRPEARAAMDAARRLAPEHPEVHRLGATVSLLTGDGAERLAAGRSSLAMDPTDADRRHDLALAQKARNPLYRALLHYSVWLDGLPRGMRLLLIAGPLLLNTVIPGAALLVIPVVLLTWALEPLMNASLLLTRRGRGLLTSTERWATAGFLAYLLAAVALGVLGLLTPERFWLIMALAAVIWALAAGSFHTVGRRGLGPARVLHLVGAVLMVASVIALLLGATLAPVAGLLVLLLGVVTLWVIALT